MPGRTSLSLAPTIVAVVTLLPLQDARGQQDPVGKVVMLNGSVSAKRSGSDVELRRGREIYEDDRVTATEGSEARLQLAGSVVQLGGGASLTVTSHNKKSRRTRLRLWSGRLWAKVSSVFGSQTSFEVETDNAVAGVRGTSFMVQSRGDGSMLVTIFEGTVEVAHGSSGATRTFEAGQQCVLTKDGVFTVEEASTADLLSSVELKDEGAEESRVSDKEKPGRSKEAVERMRVILKKILGFLTEAREDGDVVKLNCVNEKLTAVKGLLRVAEHADVNLQENLAMRESGSALHEFDKVTIAEQKSEQLLSEAQSCVGAMAVYSGDTQVEVEIDNELVDEHDPTVVIIDPLPPELPPAASPFQ